MKKVHSQLSKEEREKRRKALFPPLILLAGALRGEIALPPKNARAAKAKRSHRV